MAVSLGRAVRALVETHVRSTFNRTLRDAGLAVTIVAMVTLALLVVAFLVPLGAVAWYFGDRFGLAPDTLGYVGAVFTVVPIFACVASMIAGDVQAIDHEKLKPYPVPPRALFVAETLASFTHPLMFGAVVVQLAFAAGLAHSVRRGEGSAVIAVTLLTSLVFQGALQSLLATIAARFIRRAQVLLILSMMVAPAIGALMLDRPESHVTADTLVRNVNLLALVPPALQLGAAVPGTPLFLRVAQLLGPLVAAALLGWLAARVASREVAPRTASKVGPERPWTFRHPVVGVARLQVATLFDTELGRFALFLPLFWLVPMMILRGTPAGTPIAKELTTLFVWVLLPTTMSGFTMNQFGLDRGAVKALFLLPIDERDLLRGKSLGIAAVCFAQSVLVALLVVFFMRPSWPYALAGPLTSTALLFVHLTVGQYLSVLWPRPIQRRGLKQPNAGALAALVLIGVLFGTVGPVIVTWWLVGRAAPALLPAVMALAALAAFGLNLAFSSLAARLVVLRRERLVETLS